MTHSKVANLTLIGTRKDASLIRKFNEYDTLTHPFYMNDVGCAEMHSAQRYSLWAPRAFAAGPSCSFCFWSSISIDSLLITLQRAKSECLKQRFTWQDNKELVGIS